MQQLKSTAAAPAGSISQSKIDDIVLRMLTPMFEFGLFDTPNNGTTAANVTTQAHSFAARTISAASTVRQQLPFSLVLVAFA